MTKTPQRRMRSTRRARPELPTPVGKIQKKTQERLLARLSRRLDLTCLDDGTDRPADSNIEPERLKVRLAGRGVSDTLAVRVVFELPKVANDNSKSLCDRNHAVCRLLRHGVEVRSEACENTVVVWRVKCVDPLAKDFAVVSQTGKPKVVRRLQRPSSPGFTKMPRSELTDWAVLSEPVRLVNLPTLLPPVALGFWTRWGWISLRGGRVRFQAWLVRPDIMRIMSAIRTITAARSGWRWRKPSA